MTNCAKSAEPLVDVNSGDVNAPDRIAQDIPRDVVYPAHKALDACLVDVEILAEETSGVARCRNSAGQGRGRVWGMGRPASVANSADGAAGRRRKLRRDGREERCRWRGGVARGLGAGGADCANCAKTGAARSPRPKIKSSI